MQVLGVVIRFGPGVIVLEIRVPVKRGRIRDRFWAFTFTHRVSIEKIEGDRLARTLR